MKAKLSIIKYIFAAIIFSAGLSIFLYPTISGLVNERSQTTLISSYQESIAAISDEVKYETLEQARAYNRSLVGRQTGLLDPFDVSEQAPKVVSFLEVGGILGYLEIPMIGVELPIYDGATDANLQKGVGWLSGTSLPVGGESTHTVLSGHRGLPTSRLFTDINKMQVGDEFYIRNLTDILAYKVIEIKIVEPGDTSSLGITEGRDLATLLTCHPYMVNSHRLLIIGERTPYTGQLEVIEPSTNFIENLTPVERSFGLAILASSALLVLLVIFIWRSRKKSKKKKEA